MKRIAFLVDLLFWIQFMKEHFSPFQIYQQNTIWVVFMRTKFWMSLYFWGWTETTISHTCISGHSRNIFFVCCLVSSSISNLKVIAIMHMFWIFRPLLEYINYSSTEICVLCTVVLTLHRSFLILKRVCKTISLTIQMVSK